MLSASACAERTPVRQYSTGTASGGMAARPSPEAMADAGISTAPSMWAVWNSAGSRTSIRATALPASSMARSSSGVIDASSAASPVIGGACGSLATVMLR